MKKTITITLGGRAFTIEEDAYQALDAYVKKIRAQFKNDPNVDELVADMETGIADAFVKKDVKRKSAIITLADVNEMIAVMGEPEVIAQEETASKTPRAEASSEASRPKRLYRSTDDVMVAGVCSGLAAYLGVDPVFVRIVFVVLAFVNGIGLLAYGILWWLVPAADTSAQKLEMRGKPVNLAEMEEIVKEKAHMMSAEGKKAWERMQDAKSPARRALEVPIQVIGAIARAIFKVLAIVIKVVLGIVGVALTASAGIAIAAVTVTSAVMLFGIQSPYVQSDLPLHELIGNPMYYMALISSYFIVLVPLVLLIQLGATLLSRRNQFNALAVGILGTLWFVALTFAAAAGTHLVPWAQTRLAETEAAQTITQEVAVTDDIESLLLSGYARLHVTRGDVPSLVLTGRAESLTNVTTTIENGQLRMDTSAFADIGRLCLFCHRKGVQAELVLPSLASVEARNYARVSLDAFSEDLALTSEDYARIDADLENAASVTVSQKNYSRIFLEGSAESLNAQLEGYTRLDANGLRATTATVRTMDYSHALLRATDSLNADAQNYSRITAFGEPERVSVHEGRYASVENEEGEDWE